MENAMALRDPKYYLMFARYYVQKNKKITMPLIRLN